MNQQRNQDIQTRLKEKEDRIARVNKKAFYLNIVVFVLIILAIGAGIYGIWSLYSQHIGWHEKLGNLGSYLSGTSGTLFAFASILFIYSGLLRQQQQILQQSIEIDLNIEELQQTREEIKGQKEELELQNRNWEMQRLEEQFFRILENLRNTEFDNYSIDYRRGLQDFTSQWARSYSDKIDNNSVNFSTLKDDLITQFKATDPACFFIGQQLFHLFSKLYQNFETNKELLQLMGASISQREKEVLFFYILAQAENLNEFKLYYKNSNLFPAYKDNCLLNLIP